MSEDTSNPEASSEDDMGQGDAGAARMYPPPANFRLFLESLLSQAWVSLGKFPNPMTGESVFEEAWARYYIDMVGVLEEKTRGNLDKDESNLIEVNLSSLRLTFIEEQKAQAAIPEASTSEDAASSEDGAEGS